MSKIVNNPSILDDEKVNIQRGAIGHRATWMALTYDEARKAGKAEDAEKFARGGICRTGFNDGTKFKALCKKDPIDVSEFADIFLSETTLKSFEIDFKTKTADRIDLEFHHCPLLKAWQNLGFDDETCAKLCDMAMDGDRNIAAGMGLKFHLGDTIANGCKTCQVSFFK